MIKLKNILLEGKMGDCYPAGGRLIMDMFGDKEHMLVHGMVNGQGALEGMRYGHCWVESKDTVLDHSNGRKLEIPKQVYYALGRVNPKECKYYTPEESAKFMVEEGHWGPWEMSGDTVMAEEIPDRKPEVGKHDLRIVSNELDDIESKLMMGEVDYHSKLSRGHKPDWYQLGTSEFKPFDEDGVEENVAPNHDGNAAPYGSGYDEVEENFADGKKPGRKGISKRVGIPKGATLTQLAKLAKSKGEKGRMARWQLNMRRGKKKKK